MLSLESADADTKDDLIQLKSDLEQLIQLTEGESQLLANYNCLVLTGFLLPPILHLASSEQ